MSGSRLSKAAAKDFTFAGISTHDYLQPAVALAREFAATEWRVRETTWRPALDGEIPLWQQQGPITNDRQREGFHA